MAEKETPTTVKSRKKLFTYGAIWLVGTLVIFGVILYLDRPSPIESGNVSTNPDGSVESGERTPDPEKIPVGDYPEEYKSADLPQSELLILTTVGYREIGENERGIELDFESQDSIKILSAFFEDELTKKGWKTLTAQNPRPFLYNSQFEKDGKYFSLNMKKSGDLISGHINYPHP